jgi:uncharacterized protein YceH (UPF0502 family)
MTLMSMPDPSQAPALAEAGPQAWPALSLYERRILGVLIEKAKTTPDVYPLSSNALVTGSNQKSNRDPVLSLTEEDVEEALLSCQRRLLVIKITGGRVVRWRHNLYESWHVDKVDLAAGRTLVARPANGRGAAHPGEPDGTC